MFGVFWEQILWGATDRDASRFNEYRAHNGSFRLRNVISMHCVRLSTKPLGRLLVLDECQLMKHHKGRVHLAVRLFGETVDGCNMMSDTALGNKWFDIFGIRSLLPVPR